MGEPQMLLTMSKKLPIMLLKMSKKLPQMLLKMSEKLHNKSLRQPVKQLTLSVKTGLLFKKLFAQLLSQHVSQLVEPPWHFSKPHQLQLPLLSISHSAVYQMPWKAVVTNCAKLFVVEEDFKSELCKR